MDDVIFEEFKGTGNMELKLDRNLQERRIFPAIDVLKSGTRREEALLSEREREAVWALRREMARQSPADTMGVLLQFLKNSENGEEFTELILKNFGKSR